MAVYTATKLVTTPGPVTKGISGATQVTGPVDVQVKLIEL
jgi:hypothetical protein